MSEPKVRLLNPGPVNLTDRVRSALLRRDLCHREPEFTALMADVRGRLVRVYPETTDTYTAVLITGSGTAAVEAMVGSLVPKDRKALVVANGVYGERMGAMVAAQGRELTLVRSRHWTDPIDLDGARRALEADPRISHVLSVHHETTTGRLNDVAALGALCRKRGVALLLDAVSSFGGEPIEFEAWNVEACAATANKCLHGVPGVSFVLAREGVFAERKTGASSVYLDLFGQYEAQASGHPAFTPAVHVTYALQEALAELEDQGGWSARHAEYVRRSGRLRAGLQELGYRLLLPDESACAATLTAFLLPAGLDFDQLYEHTRRDGFVIYPGQKTLMSSIFRLAVMGELGDADLDALLRSFAALGTAKQAR